MQCMVFKCKCIAHETFVNPDFLPGFLSLDFLSHFAIIWSNVDKSNISVYVS